MFSSFLSEVCLLSLSVILYQTLTLLLLSIQDFMLLQNIGALTFIKLDRNSLPGSRLAPQDLPS